MKKETFIILFSCLIVTLIILLRFDYSWDDSAITIGFARNLHDFGTIAPGQFSDKVEGFSTLSWMFVNYIFFLIGLNSGHVLLTAKILSLIINLFNVYLVYKIFKFYLKKEITILLGIILFVFSRSFLYDSQNGMETPLFLMFLLLMFLNYIKENRNSKDNLLFCLYGIGVTITRFEGLWFLLPFFIFDSVKYKFGVIKKYYYYLWILSFLGCELFRYIYFGELIPNSILAKTQVSYNVENYLFARLFPFLTLLKSFLPITILVFIFLYFYYFKLKIISYKGLWQPFVFVLIGSIFNLIVGKSMGQPDRMFFSVLPFIILLLIKPFTFLEVYKPLFYKVLIISAIFGYIFYNVHYFEIHRTSSVEEVRKVALDIDNLNKTLEQNKIIYAGCDMGGLILFGNHLRIIDMGLLCNKYLAYNGFSNFANYIFNVENPDIIKINFYWFFFDQLKNSSELYNNYQPLVIAQYVYYINNPLMTKLQISGRLKIFSRSIDNLIASGEVVEGDRDVLLKFKTIWELK